MIPNVPSPEGYEIIWKLIAIRVHKATAEIILVESSSGHFGHRYVASCTLGMNFLSAMIDSCGCLEGSIRFFLKCFDALLLTSEYIICS